MCARFNFSRWPALNSRQTTRANINYSAPWATVSMLELHRAAICPVPETSWPARGPGAPVRRYALNPTFKLTAVLQLFEWKIP